MWLALQERSLSIKEQWSFRFSGFETIHVGHSEWFLEGRSGEGVGAVLASKDSVTVGGDNTTHGNDIVNKTLMIIVELIGAQAMLHWAG